MKKLVEKSLISLISFEICGKSFDKSHFDVNNTEFYTLLYKLSDMHDMAHIVYCALEKNGLLPTDKKVADKFKKAKVIALYKSEIISSVLNNIHKTFSQNNIKYVLLKGSVIRDYYPEQWQRTSSDIDIFVDEKDLDKATLLLTDKLGYKKQQSVSTYDMHFIADSNLPLELHYSLDVSAEDIKRGVKIGDVFLNGQNQSGSLYKMSDELFYYFQLIHFAKHFRSGGAGIRPLLDLWILDKMGKNNQQAQKFIEQRGLKEFHIEIKRVIDAWFNDKEPSEFTQNLSRFIMASGTHGNIYYQRQISMISSKNKFAYYFKRIYMPYKQLVFKYPNLKKNKMLYPIYLIKRIIDARNRKEYVKSELGIVNNISEQKRKEIYDIYKKLNLF